MKKALLLILTLFSVQLFSQGLTVSTQSPQLLSEKIVNTKCFPTTNWVVKSGSDFGEVNSVGVFAKTPGSLFPFVSGVVLSTGSLNNIPGPKMLPNYIGDGTIAWTGDADMNTALGATNFVNASSLEFQFTPQQTQFKLNYVFASEEYGNNQCNSISDAMVILLTDLTAGTPPVNIAKTATTNQIITVPNIRENIFNTSCSDVNPGLFDIFYGGVNASSAPINFFGRTVSMTANATVDLTHTYKIKIVIADRSDIQYDSAVFIEQYVPQYQAQTVLGNDLTIATNNAQCEGLPYTFNTGLSSSYSYLWRKDGTAIPGANGPSYTIPDIEAIGTHTYSVLYTINTCNAPDGYFDSVVIQYLPPVLAQNPTSVNRCLGDTSPYNLTLSTPSLNFGLPYTPIVSYHANATQAQNGQNPLPTSYSGPLTTIFIRIAQQGNPCPFVSQFTLGTVQPPNLANFLIPGPLELCSRTPTILNAITNLTSLTPDILNGQPPLVYGVSYHSTAIGATNNTDIITTDGAGLAIIPTTLTSIHIRIFVIGSLNCSVSASFPVTITPLQGVDPVQDVVYCGPSYTLPTLTNGKYFTNAYDGTNLNSQLPEIPALSTISIPSGHIGTYTTIIYVSNLVTATNDCTQEFPLKITLIQPTTFSETSQSYCDKYVLPVLEYGDYWTGPNGTGTLIPGGTELTETTTIYFNFQSEINTPLNPQCSVPAGPVTITIEKKPDLGSDRQNVFTCSPPYILPTLVGFPGANYYDNPNGTGTPIPSGPLSAGISTSTDVYVYLEDTTGTLNCPNVDYFRVVVGIDPIANISQCNYILPEPVVGTYWNGPHQPDGSCIGCTQLFPGDYVEQSMTIWVYVEPPAGEVCTTGQNQTSFQVNLTQPVVDDIAGFVSPYCGPFQLPLITNGKYYTESHLNGGTGGTEIPAGTIISSNQSVYVYNFNPGTLPLCDFEKKFDFVINPIPEIDTSVNTFIDLCNITSYILPVLTNGKYYTGANGTGSLLTTETERTITGPFPVTVFIYNVDPTTGCEAQKPIRITSSTTLSDDPPNPIEEHCTSYLLPDLTVSTSRYHKTEWTDQTTPPANILIPNPSVWAMPVPTDNFYDQTIYIYNSTLDGVRETCPLNKPIRIVLYKQPNIVKPNDIYICDGSPYTLPALSTGQKYYKESHLAGGTVFTELTGQITETQRVYVYEENNSIIPNSNFKCIDEEFFDVNIFKVDTVSDISGCGSITLPALTSGNYFTGAGGFGALGGTTITNNSGATVSFTVYIYGASGFPATECQSDENQFQVTITPIPIINSIPLYDNLLIDRTYCDTDDTNDGLLNIDLTQYDSTILGPTQTGSEFSVTYHNSESEALANENPVNSSLSNNNSLYAVVRNETFSNCSSAPMKLEFVVNKLPEPTPEDAYLCINNVTGLPISTVTLDSGLSSSNYTFEWKDETNAIVSTSSTFTTDISGDYTMTATDIDPTKGCVSNIETVSIIESSIAIAGYTITQDFSENQVITVIADGYGDNYVYQLDGGLFQESNVFSNVPSGNHVIVIRDKNGCGDSSPIEALILNYPLFFTPNGDSYNDLWNIYDLQELNDPNAKISIFDRQGKLLKQISPFGLGWDGKHNGNELPSTDYWFKVNYTRDNVTREFKSHFALKR